MKWNKMPINMIFLKKNRKSRKPKCFQGRVVARFLTQCTIGQQEFSTFIYLNKIKTDVHRKPGAEWF